MTVTSIEQKLALHTGRQMPALGLGTWQLTQDTAGTVATALELGYRLIDTAEDYGTQSGIGEGFRRSGLDRSDLYLAAKVEETDEAHDATRALGAAYEYLIKYFADTAGKKCITTATACR